MILAYITSQNKQSRIGSELYNWSKLMAETKIFSNLRVLVIKTDDISSDELSNIKRTIEENGALDCVVHEPIRQIDCAVAEKERFISQFPEQIHCIITRTVEFSFYRVATFDLLIPIVSPAWIEDCLKFNRLMRTTCYSPNPIHFLKDCYVYVSKHALNEVEYPFYCSVITAFGGTCMDYLSTKATHIVTWDKNDVAIKAMQKFQKYRVQYVMPNWLIDCLAGLEYVKEDSYLIDVQWDDSQLKRRSEELWEKTMSNLDNWKKTLNFRLEKKVVLGDDLALPGSCYKFFLNWIKQCLGCQITLVAEPSQLAQSNADIYVGHSASSESVSIAKANGLICANIAWFFYIWQMQEFVHPSSKLLLSPLKKPVFTKEELRATFTNYYGEQRYYIQQLTEALGGICTTELTKKNSHLISAIAFGKKFNAAKAWDCCIPVNHLWLEKCYKQGEKLDPMLPEFQQFPVSGGIKSSLGQMALEDIASDTSPLLEKPQKATELYMDSQEAAIEEPIVIPDKLSDVEDASKGQSEQRKLEEAEAEAETEAETEAKVETIEKKTEQQEVVKESTPFQTNNGSKNIQDASDFSNNHENEFSADKSSIATPMASREATTQFSNESPDPTSQPLTPMSDSMRKAKAKAAEKLHTDIESLNEFQRINKRRRSPEILPEAIQELKKHKALDSKAEELVSYLNISHKPYRIKAVLTNCHENISDLDILVLSKVGIMIYPEVESNTNTVIAPKKARTAKFLKSFSFKPLKYALTPMFITQVLSNIKKEKPIELQMEKYFIPDIDPKVLEKTKLPTKVFERHGFTHVNISDDIPGGCKLISSILKCHGMKEVNPLGKKFDMNDIVKNTGSKRSPDYVLIASKASMAKKFNKCVKDTDKSNKVFVVEWNWCVKSIFNLDIDIEDHEYVIYNK